MQTLTKPSYDSHGQNRAAHTEHMFHVLVIGDSEADRELAAAHLDRIWPFEHTLAVECASDIEEALQGLEHARHALIVLLWQLPALADGGSLRTLRRNGVSVPVVILSPMPSEEIRAEVESLGGSFLEKDEMNPSGLREAISESLWLLHHTVNGNEWLRTDETREVDRRLPLSASHDS